MLVAGVAVFGGACVKTATDYVIEVNLASPDSASKPIPVTLAVDTADFNEMNDSVGDIYTLLPAR